jgi:hypothetical protein
MMRASGRGKLEFAVAVFLFGIFAAALLNRLIGIEQAAERTEVDLTIRNLRVGLQLAVGEMLMRGEENRLPELIDRNPISFLGRAPRGYEDGISGPESTARWKYDEKSRMLSYEPLQSAAFDGRTELRWRIRADWAANGRIRSVRLENVVD